MSVLLDSNILIDYLRRTNAALALINGYATKPSVSVVSVTELYAGAISTAEERAMEGMLRSSRILPVAVDIARVAGQHIKHYQSSHGLDDFDAIIAATAEYHGLALATRNVKNFPMFPKLKPAY